MMSVCATQGGDQGEAVQGSEQSLEDLMKQMQTL